MPPPRIPPPPPRRMLERCWPSGIQGHGRGLGSGVQQQRSRLILGHHGMESMAGMYKVPPPAANLLRTLRRRNYGRYGHNPTLVPWLPGCCQTSRCTARACWRETHPFFSEGCPNMCNGRSNVTSGTSVWPELHISSSLAFASTLSMGNTLVHVYAASGTRRVRQQSSGSEFWPPHIRRHHLRLCVGVAHQKDCRLVDFVRGVILVIRNAGSLVLSPRFCVDVHRPPEGLRLVDFVRGVILVIRSAGNLRVCVLEWCGGVEQR